MEQKMIGGAKKYAVIGIALLMSMAILVPIANGDVILSGSITIVGSQAYLPPEITVNQTNQTYQGATFANFTTVVQNGVSYTMIQIHLNFKLNNTTKHPNFTTLLLNILQVFNSANVSGNFTVKLVKSAQSSSNKSLNSSFTNALHVYMTHQHQNASVIAGSPELMNNTTTTFDFYPFNGSIPMYWIGFNYTEPPYPLPTGSDQNSLQQFVNLTFKVKSITI